MSDSYNLQRGEEAKDYRMKDKDYSSDPEVRGGLFRMCWQKFACCHQFPNKHNAGVLTIL